MFKISNKHYGYADELSREKEAVTDSDYLPKFLSVGKIFRPMTMTTLHFLSQHPRPTTRTKHQKIGKKIISISFKYQMSVFLLKSTGAKCPMGSVLDYIPSQKQ